MDKPRFNQLPNPDRNAVRAWLSSLSLRYLHDTGWTEVNGRVHEVAMASRTFANQKFPDQPGKREDFLDGVTFGLLALIHASDIDELNALLAAEAGEPERTIPAATEPLPVAGNQALPLNGRPEPAF